MSKRVAFDCRSFPGPCTLVLTGTEEEVLAAGIQHTVAAHEQTDGPELRSLLRSHFVPEEEWVEAQKQAAAE